MPDPVMFTLDDPKGAQELYLTYFSLLVMAGPEHSRHIRDKMMNDPELLANIADVVEISKVSNCPNWIAANFRVVRNRAKEVIALNERQRIERENEEVRLARSRQPNFGMF